MQVLHNIGKEGKDLILFIETLKNIDNTILVKNSFLESNTRGILNSLLPIPKESNYSYK